MRIPGYNGSGTTGQEIEVRAFVGLLHMADVQLDVTPFRTGSSGLPFASAPLQLGFVNLQVQPPPFHVQFDTM